MKSESAVKDRYAAASKAREPALCCPVDDAHRYPEAIPSEVIERAHGCGAPSRHVRQGETVLDLGSGTGKIRFIAAQPVGPGGEVIGVDMTHDTPEVARRNAPAVPQNIGYANAEFRKGRIQDLALDPDTVADEEVPGHLQNDPELWGGRISGALTEEGFLRAFENAGFYGIEIPEFNVQPWRSVEGIGFRSMTIQAYNGKQRPCVERNRAATYRGPFREVLDDGGRRMERGEPYAACDKTYSPYQNEPYAGSFDFILPLHDTPPAEAAPFDCARPARRHTKETKGQNHDATIHANSRCCEGGSCC